MPFLTGGFLDLHSRQSMRREDREKKLIALLNILGTYLLRIGSSQKSDNFILSQDLTAAHAHILGLHPRGHLPEVVALVLIASPSHVNLL